MRVSLSNTRYLCEDCIHCAIITGAHRGGIYCQRGERPYILESLPRACDNYTYDKGGPHKRRFELKDYPGLLSWQELKSLND